jgi:uncharacterized membrane protein
MARQVAGFIILGIGVLLILLGAVKYFQRSGPRSDQGVGRRPGASEDVLAGEITALSKLTAALNKSTPAMQLVVLGIVLVLVGSVLLAL